MDNDNSGVSGTGDDPLNHAPQPFLLSCPMHPITLYLRDLGQSQPGSGPQPRFRAHRIRRLPHAKSQSDAPRRPSDPPLCTFAVAWCLPVGDAQIGMIGAAADAHSCL
jgi:hypothetical protein